MSEITFEAIPYSIHDWTVLRLPDDASMQLPSRGMTMVAGSLNRQDFQAVLEPDGRYGHWFKLESGLIRAAGVQVGKPAQLVISTVKKWWRPEVPADLELALATSASAHKLWNDITPNAQWEWIRWIRSTKKAETRQRRISVALSKLNAGSRRPCCFNRNLCSEPYVSHNWQLIEPVNSVQNG